MWVIEHEDGKRWRTLDSIGMPDWTDDVNKALAVSLKEHAELFAQDDDEPVHVVQRCAPEQQPDLDAARRLGDRDRAQGSRRWLRHLRGSPEHCVREAARPHAVERSMKRYDWDYDGMREQEEDGRVPAGEYVLAEDAAAEVARAQLQTKRADERRDEAMARLHKAERRARQLESALNLPAEGRVFQEGT